MAKKRHKKENASNKRNWQKAKIHVKTMFVKPNY
jgi:hypothetical protein